MNISVLPDVNSNAMSERVFIELYDPSVTSWNTTTYCNPSSPPKLEEYHIMVKQGQLCRISKTFFFVLNIASWSEISDVFLALLMIFYLPG